VLGEQRLVSDGLEALAVERGGVELEVAGGRIEQQQALGDVVAFLACGAGLFGEEELLRLLGEGGEVVGGDRRLDAGEARA
jgi:hypothetical protein